MSTHPDHSPNAATEAPQATNVSTWHVLRLGFTHPRLLTLALLLIACGVALSLAQPMVTKLVIDSAGDLPTLTRYVLLLAGLFVLQTFADAAGQYSLERASEHITRDLRVSAVTRIIRAPLTRLARFRTGDLLSRAVNDSSVVREMLATSLVQVLTITLYGAGTVALMAWLDPLLLVVLLATILIVAVIIIAMLASIRRASEKHQENMASFTSELERVLGSLRTVKAFLAEDREMRRIAQSIEGTHDQGIRLARLNALVSPAIELAANGALLLVLLIGGLRVANGSIAVGDLVAFLLYAMFLIMPLLGMLNALTLLQRGRASLQRIEQLRALGQEDTRGQAIPSTDNRARQDPAIEFDRVSFSRGSRTILDEVSFTLPAIGMVALVGPSGVGKSTILDLIERFEVPDSGVIRVRGEDAAGIALPELRCHVALVDQDAPIMEGTLRDNLAYAAPTKSDQQFRTALAAAGLAQFGTDSEACLNTRVGERGRTLSGGERQRLALARVLLRDAAVYLLDEPSSQLDDRSEQILLAALRTLSKERLVLIVSHRHTTVVEVDQVLTLEKGRVTSHNVTTAPAHMTRRDRDLSSGR